MDVFIIVISIKNPFLLVGLDNRKLISSVIIRIKELEFLLHTVCIFLLERINFLIEQ